jgi:galactokinase
MIRDACALAFSRAFGRAPSVVADAPGRVNLMGEHTDYNFGFVLPMPIPQRTYVALAPRDDRFVRLLSEQAPEPIKQYELGRELPTGSWIDYVQGVTRELLAFAQLSHGFDLYVSSDVPVGAGLSSSAALEVSTLRALRDAFGLEIEALDIARVGQRAEVNFVGAPVGVMDQMAASLGVQGSALLIDTRDLSSRTVHLPGELELIVIASGVTHAHGTGDYRMRRAECEQAAQRLGLRSLRELGSADLSRLSTLPAPLDRRARHVITENARVLETREALERGDRERLSKLFAASHASQRDDFEVSVHEIDLLVQLGASEPSVVGARLTGGGFGGSVVMLAERGQARAAAERIAASYARATSREPRILLPRAES